MTNHLYDRLFGPHADNSATFLKQDGATNLSYADFLRMAARIAHVLSANGVEPGDRIVVQAPKTVEMVALYAATVQVGAVFLPLNTAYKFDEVAYFVGDATPKVIVCDGTRAADLTELAQTAGAALLTLNADGTGSLTRDLNQHPDRFKTINRAPEDLAALLYTSGTTGRSKGAMLSHDNLLSNAEALTELWQITAEDTLIHALPIFHTHGLFVALNTALLAGTRVHFMPTFDLDAIVAAIPHATLLMGVPTFYTRLLSDERLGHDLTSNMRLFVSGSAPLLAETHVEFSARTGHRILERYGMTETNMITSNPFDGDRRAGTVGLSLPGVEVQLTHPDTRNSVAPGEVGMIEVRGPNVFQGYWQMPEKTAAELKEDGFFITGDLGQMSDDGYLSIVGREKDLIITGGYNVYPKEIEDVLNEVDGVIESAVFGVPDADFGEAIVAAAVLEDDCSLGADQLSAAVLEKLARFKHPRRYEIIQELPRNTMGKVQKNVLRDTYS